MLRLRGGGEGRKRGRGSDEDSMLMISPTMSDDDHEDVRACLGMAELNLSDRILNMQLPELLKMQQVFKTISFNKQQLLGFVLFFL